MKLLTTIAFALVFCSQNIMAQDNLDSRDQGRHARERALGKELKKIRGQDSKNTKNNTNPDEGSPYDANPNCDQYGYCGGGSGYYSPMYPGVPHNPNQVILNGGLTNLDPYAWQKTVEALTPCGGALAMDELCTFIYAAYPRLEVSVYVDDYKMTNGVSNGRIVLSSQTMDAIPLPVSWRAIDNNTGFVTQVLLPYEYKGHVLNVRVAGRTTDSRVVVELFYGNQSVGSGQLNRVNTGAQPTPYPTSY